MTLCFVGVVLHKLTLQGEIVCVLAMVSSACRSDFQSTASQYLLPSLAMAWVKCWTTVLNSVTFHVIINN